MKRPKSRLVSAGEMRSVLQKIGHAIDEELSAMTRMTVYQIPGGGALLDLGNGRGRLYASRDEWIAMRQETVRLIQSGANPLRDLLSKEGDFIARVSLLIGRLPEILHLDPATLDGSEESLDAVDQSLRRMPADDRLSATVFPALTAYVGEVIRMGVGGRWHIRVDGDGSPWEPDILDARGERCALLRMYKELFEYGRRASLRAFARITILAHRPSS